MVELPTKTPPQGDNRMTFNLNIAANETVIKAKDIRQSLVESAFVTTAQNVKSGDWTRDQAAKALQPLVDTLTSGVKEKGHADKIKTLVQSNLDSALAAMETQEKPKSDK
jgi:hypothetical protein